MNTSTQNIILKRTNSQSTDFLNLVIELDKDLHSRYGEQQKFFDQFNKLDNIKHVVIAYIDDTPVGCGSFKEYEPGTVEIKRMYVAAEHRGHGIAVRILNELELWAAELNYQNCILETAKSQPEAIKLYHKCNYQDTANYGDYIGVELSVCMRKPLK